jgi:hypothetical protein
MIASSTSCFVLSAMDGKIEQRFCIKSCMKLGKCATGSFETLEASGDYSQRFSGDIHVSSPVECQMKMTKVQGDNAPAKRQKMLKEFENSSTKTVAEQSMRSQAPLGSVMECSR